MESEKLFSESRSPIQHENLDFNLSTNFLEPESDHHNEFSNQLFTTKTKVEFSNNFSPIIESSKSTNENQSVADFDQRMLAELSVENGGREQTAHSARRWSENEKNLLCEGLAKFGWGNWGLISTNFLPWRDMDRIRSFAYRTLDKQDWEHVGVIPRNKRKWTESEDYTLFQALQNHGYDNWTKISAELPERTDSAIIQRASDLGWTNTGGLSSNWTLEEDKLLKEGLKLFGWGKWKGIRETKLPNRSEHGISDRARRLFGSRKCYENPEQDQEETSSYQTNPRKRRKVSRSKSAEPKTPLIQTTEDTFHTQNLLISSIWSHSFSPVVPEELQQEKLDEKLGLLPKTATLSAENADGPSATLPGNVGNAQQPQQSQNFNFPINSFQPAPTIPTTSTLPELIQLGNDVYMAQIPTWESGQPYYLPQMFGGPNIFFALNLPLFHGFHFLQGLNFFARHGERWTAEENRLLKEGIEQFGWGKWIEISIAKLWGRSPGGIKDHSKDLFKNKENFEHMKRASESQIKTNEKGPSDSAQQLSDHTPNLYLSSTECSFSTGSHTFDHSDISTQALILQEQQLTGQSSLHDSQLGSSDPQPSSLPSPSNQSAPLPPPSIGQPPPWETGGDEEFPDLNFE